MPNFGITLPTDGPADICSESFRMQRNHSLLGQVRTGIAQEVYPKQSQPAAFIAARPPQDICNQLMDHLNILVMRVEGDCRRFCVCHLSSLRLKSASLVGLAALL